MVLKAMKFTPEVMLSGHRRSPGVPDSSGYNVLGTVSSYNFHTHESTSEIRLWNQADETFLIERNKKSSDPVWLEGTEMALLRGTEEGTTQLVIGDAKDFENTQYIAGTIDAPCSNLKIVKLGKRQFGLALTAMASPDGTLHNPEKMPKKHTTGMLYRSLFVRHWDSYIEPARQSIWYGTLLPRKGESADKARTTYFLSPLTNALKGSRLESPMPPFGGGDNFEISTKGLIFIARDPLLSPALHTKCNIYLVPLSNFLETTPELLTVLTRGYNGAMASPVFSKDGTQAAFLVMKQDGYEADKNHILVMPDTTRPAQLVDLLSSKDGAGRWDRSPSNIVFGADGDDQLYLLAENHGNKLIYTVSLHPAADEVPKAYTDSGSVTDVKILPDGDVFISATTFTENSTWVLVPRGEDYRTKRKLLATPARNKYGLSEDQVSEIWFEGAGHNPDTDDKVQAWVVKPSSFDAKKTYPLAFLVHGGPQGSWSNAWSTRWNAAVFAEQGYVVVLPNPTGSTGFGQKFTDDINEQWGGLPYHDLENCFAHIEKHMPYVDTARAVALGASYGGYCMNWFQGHALGKRFKALVNHDGIFSTLFEHATDELYFVNHDLGGAFMHNKEKWRKWDPAEHMDKWFTPMLVIHSELDYRLTMADGLATFNVLQMRGVESELLVFKDENHFVQKPENSLVWHSVVLNWINKHVGLPPYREDVAKAVIQDP